MWTLIFHSTWSFYIVNFYEFVSLRGNIRFLIFLFLYTFSYKNDIYVWAQENRVNNEEIKNEEKEKKESLLPSLYFY